MPKKKYHFAVLIEQDEDGVYVATAPALPGCHTQAKTLPELDERIREAIALCRDVEQGYGNFRWRLSHIEKQTLTRY